MGRAPILAAGGIVVRSGRQPLIAVVKMRKYKAWVLPKGKLKPEEDALAAAKREVVEETGHDVSVHEFLGAMSYEASSGKTKVVQFWRMEAIGGPVHELMSDVKAVQWLPLEQALEKLTHPREQVFLAHVGPLALRAAEQSVRGDRPAERSVHRNRRVAQSARKRTVAPTPARTIAAEVPPPAPAQIIATAEPAAGPARTIAAAEPAVPPPAPTRLVEVASPSLRNDTVEAPAASAAPEIIEARAAWTPNNIVDVEPPEADVAAATPLARKTLIGKMLQWVRDRRPGG